MNGAKLTAESSPLQKNTCFFSDANMARLTEIMYVQPYSAGQLLFAEGEPAVKLYYLRRGRVKITKSSEDGKIFTLHMYGAGDLFGQIDPSETSVYNVNAEALEDCEVGVIQQKDLEILLWQHGDLAVEFMKWMGAMHRLTETKFRDLMMYGKPGALCSTLIRLSNTYGEHGPDGIRITRKFTHSDLADMISATRESVNRMLQDLKKAGAVITRGGYFIITNMDYLKNTCHCDNCPAYICRI
jgi:CRP/FNR family transcriptional regulator